MKVPGGRKENRLRVGSTSGWPYSSLQALNIVDPLISLIARKNRLLVRGVGKVGPAIEVCSVKYSLHGSFDTVIAFVYPYNNPSCAFVNVAPLGDLMIAPFNRIGILIHTHSVNPYLFYAFKEEG